MRIAEQGKEKTRKMRWEALLGCLVVFLGSSEAQDGETGNLVDVFRSGFIGKSLTGFFTLGVVDKQCGLPESEGLANYLIPDRWPCVQVERLTQPFNVV